MNPPPQSFDQFLAALSEWLSPVVVSGYLPEIADLYCDGATVAEVAKWAGAQIAGVCVDMEGI